jgi:hypothetical protein
MGSRMGSALKISTVRNRECETETTGLRGIKLEVLQMRELVTNRSQALHLLSVCLSVCVFGHWIHKVNSAILQLLMSMWKFATLFIKSLKFSLWNFLMNSTWNIYSENCERFCEQMKHLFWKLWTILWTNFKSVSAISPRFSFSLSRLHCTTASSSTANFLLCFFL